MNQQNKNDNLKNNSENKSFMDYIKNSTIHYEITQIIDYFFKNTKYSDKDRNDLVIFSMINLAILIFVIIILYIFYDILKDPTEIINNNNIVYVGYVSIIIVILILLAIFKVSETGKDRLFAFFIILLIIFFGYIKFNEAISQLSSSNQNYVSMIIPFIVCAIILVAMSIVISSFGEKLLRLKGFSGFIIHFLLFIPCLFNDFIAFIKSQFALTPSVHYILLTIEIVLITMYFLLPRIVHSELIKNGHTILKNPTFLSKESVIATSENIPLNDMRKINYNESREPKKNYSLSMWIYLNQNTESLVSKHIFSFGNENLEVFKPKILYLGNNSNFMDKIKIIFGNGNNDCNNDFSRCDSASSIDIHPQKWNNLVFNYNDTQVDLFLNGKLTKSITLTHSTTPFVGANGEITDNITIGDDELNGSICNIVMFNDPLDHTTISRMYNSLYNISPPINNIV